MAIEIPVIDAKNPESLYLPKVKLTVMAPEIFLEVEAASCEEKPFTDPPTEPCDGTD